MSAEAEIGVFGEGGSGEAASAGASLEMEVPRARSLLRDAFGRSPSGCRLVAGSATSNSAPRRRSGSYSPGPTRRCNSSADNSCNNFEDGDAVLDRGSVALELRSILAGGASSREDRMDRSSYFGCSPPPRDSFPLVRDDSFAKRLASRAPPSSAAHPTSCAQFAWAQPSHIEGGFGRFGACASPCSGSAAPASGLSSV